MRYSGTSKLLQRGIPVEFWISGYNRTKESEENVCDCYARGDLEGLCAGSSATHLIRVASPFSAKSIEAMLLSIKMTFDSSEPNKLFRIAISENNSIASIDECKRQTAILKGDGTDAWTGETITIWNIPLHTLIDKSSPQRYYYLTVRFDSQPIGNFSLTRFNIKGVIQVGEDYDYKVW